MRGRTSTDVKVNEMQVVECSTYVGILSAIKSKQHGKDNFLLFAIKTSDDCNYLLIY